MSFQDTSIVLVIFILGNILRLLTNLFARRECAGTAPAIMSQLFFILICLLSNLTQVDLLSP